MFAPTKYSRRQIFASTKYSRRQNIRVNKILASTESRRRQNVGECVGASPYCFAPAESAAADFSLPRWYSPTSLRRCWSLHVQSPSVLLPLTALLLWADSHPHCTGILYRPAMQKKCAYQDFTNFSQTISVHILMASKLRPSQRSKAEVSECPNGIGSMGGGGEEGEGEGTHHCPYHAKVRQGCE